MTLTRLNTRIPTFWREFDELFRDLAPTATAPDAVRALVPPTDITETEKAIELKVDLPGVTPDGIEVKLDGKLLTLSAERKQEAKEEHNGWVRQERSWGRFFRSFTLPDSVEGTTPEASYKHGVLTVTLPKKEAAQPRSFKVKVEA
ncbi:MAG: Hsp20/alpha crystallin family protein [Myxococcaceae bacterium]|nr:Hsp20/alpha crystallin family protein [Myxococcaceae bacterium]MCA3014119.1 Hsp20/alpha crystallin family protein [Myxococcaceae bacterium]